MSISKKKKACWDFDSNYIEHVDQFKENYHFNNEYSVHDHGVFIYLDL